MSSIEALVYAASKLNSLLWELAALIEPFHGSIKYYRISGRKAQFWYADGHVLTLKF